MSRDMLLNMSIAAKANHDTIRALLQRGLEIGLQYRGETLHGEALVTKMTQKILNGFAYQRELHPPDLSYDIMQVARLNIQAHDTFFTLFFHETNNYITLSLSPDWDLWYRPSREEGHIDWERYSNLMFSLCKDFVVIKLETWDSYYDEN